MTGEGGTLLGHSPNGFVIRARYNGILIWANDETGDCIGVPFELGLLLAILSIPNPAGRSLFSDSTCSQGFSCRNVIRVR